MAKWEDLNWDFMPGSDSFFMATSPGAQNRFRLQPSAVPGEEPHIYEVVTVNSNDVAPFWSGLKLLPQHGVALKAKTHANAANQVTNGSADDFERLVGFVSMNGEDNPVTFYKADNGSKSLLVVKVNMIGASPGGIVQGVGNP